MRSLEQLKKIALRIGIFGGIATFAVINSIPYILSSKIRKSDHYKEAIQLLHSHPEAVKYLGKPINEKRIKTTSKEDFGTDENRMWFKVPVKGPKGSGKLFYDCSTKKTANNQFQLLNVELMLDEFKDYKLIIKKTE